MYRYIQVCGNDCNDCFSLFCFVVSMVPAVFLWTSKQTSKCKLPMISFGESPQIIKVFHRF